MRAVSLHLNGDAIARLGITPLLLTLLSHFRQNFPYISVHSIHQDKGLSLNQSMLPRLKMLLIKATSSLERIPYT